MKGILIVAGLALTAGCGQGDFNTCVDIVTEAKIAQRVAEARTVECQAAGRQCVEANNTCTAALKTAKGE